MALKRRFVYVLPFAVLFVVVSLPTSGDPQYGIEPLPFDPVSCGLGISLALIATGAKFFPRRVFFLLDSLWFAALAVMLLNDIAHGTHWSWMILVAVHIHVIVLGIRQYRRFSTLQDATAAAGETSRQHA